MTTLLVDGNNLLARSDHAAKASHAEMSVDGVSTGALVIFINMLAKYVRLVEPTRMAVFWDAGHTLRDAAYPAYKAARKKVVDGSEDSAPFAQAKEFLTWAGVPHKAHTGYEADDLIAATSRQCVGKVVILSGDKDLLQLVSNGQMMTQPPHQGVVRTISQIRVPDEIEWTEAHVEAKFGVLPHHLSHYLALVGDPGDGVPGVRGIGPKKALALLEQAEWDWEAVGDLLGPEKAQEASLMHSLVDLRTFPYAEAFMAVNAGCPPFSPPSPNPDSASWLALMDFCTRYRLETVRERLVAGTLWVDKSSGLDLFEDLDAQGAGSLDPAPDRA